MRKRVIAVIITALCLTACGNTPAVSNDVSNPVSDVSKITESIMDMSETAEADTDVSKLDEVEVKSAEESAVNGKAALYDKYADICDCLENKDYDKAIELIEAMKPEPATETISLTLENWSTYFSRENVIRPLNQNANGEIMEAAFDVYLVLKPEYVEKMISLSGEIGYECDLVPHIVTNIDKETGLFDTELIESGPADEEAIGRRISTTKQLDYSRGGIEIANGIKGDEKLGLRGLDISIYYADEGNTQYLYYPEEINVIRFNGELVLNK